MEPFTGRTMPSRDLCHFRICAGFRMPAIDSRATFTGGRRPKAAKERTRGDSAERLPRTPLWGFELRDKCEGWCAEPLAAVDEPGRQQQRGDPARKSFTPKLDVLATL